VVVNYLPVGSEEAVKWYAEQVLAGCAMVNCMPVSSREPWQRRRAGVLIIGDDIKSQVGATITHRVLTPLRERGVHLDRRCSSTSAATRTSTRSSASGSSRRRSEDERGHVDARLRPGAGNVHVGPSDHVPWLIDRVGVHPHGGLGVGDVPLNVEPARGVGLAHSGRDVMTPYGWRSCPEQRHAGALEA
jgi:myo-inositol-1-phosphate synthase